MHFNALRISFILFSLLLCNWAVGQIHEERKWEFQLNAHAGKLMKIYDPFPENRFTTILQGSFYRSTKGSSNWHNWQGYPAVGLTAAWLNFQPNKILGSAIGLIPEMKFGLEILHMRCYMHAGLGIAWFNKPYNTISNPDNLVIGARLANMSCIGLETTGYAGKCLGWTAGLAYTHCSNGHVAVPNIGANIVSCHIGLLLRSSQIIEREKNAESSAMQSNKLYPFLQIMGGVHEFQGTISPRDGIRYKKGGISFGLEKIHTPLKRHAAVPENSMRIIRGKYAFGLNLYYDQALYQQMILQEIFPGEANNRTKAMNLALFGSYEWLFGRFAFFVQGGIDLYAPGKNALNQIWNLPKTSWIDRYTSNKIGYKYYFLSPVCQSNYQYPPRIRPFLTIAVKANGGTADYLEFSLGFVFGKMRCTS